MKIKRLGSVLIGHRYFLCGIMQCNFVDFIDSSPGAQKQGRSLRMDFDLK